MTARWRWPDDDAVARLAPAWQPRWQQFSASTDGERLRAWLSARVAAGAVVVPAAPLRALELTPLESVRVVIVGQDPYHGEGQAHGLAFSVPAGVPIPPSLRNIRAEVARDVGAPPAANGSLEAWARDGVLLLNAVLTVELDRPAAHARRGWEVFTGAVLQATAADAAPKVFMLWGAFAQSAADTIRAAGRDHVPPHLILTANHPSPLSARRGPTPFIGCGHFARANAFLQQHGRPPVRWT